WAKKGVGATGLDIYIRWYTSGGVFISDGAPSSFTLTTSWQRFTTRDTAPATAAFASVQARLNGGAINDYFLLDGAQFELGAIPTPYIETNGATATRTAGVVSGSNVLISSVQGGVALRVRPGWSNANSPTGATAWDWSVSGNDQMV